MPTFLKKLSSKKLLLLFLCLAVIAVVVAIGSPKKAVAQTCNPACTAPSQCTYNGDGSTFCLTTTPTQPPAQVAPAAPQKISWYTCATSPVSCSLFFITLAANAVMNLFVAFGAFLVRTILSLGTDLLNLSAVQKGFGLSLSVANLGFVLGIIVIALATILRSQTYGIKQILWKLVVAAIAVNFGLVIAGVILNFSDTLTKSFLKPMGGEGGFTDQLVSAIGASSAETPPLLDVGGTGLASCAALTAISPVAGIACVTAQLASGRVTATDNNADPLLRELDNFMRNVLSLVFAIVFKFIIVFTLFALAILLLIRFVYISVLLVLLPLAWLMWIFPKFSHLNGKWWQNFLRWAFFPPIVVFFLYLAILTNAEPPKYVAIPGPKGGTPESSLGMMTGNSLLLGGMAKSLLVIALALGGLFAANSFSIHGASVAMGALKGAGAGFANWAQKAPGRAGRAAARAATREGPTKPLIPKYEQPKGRFQQLVNAVHRGEARLRGATGPVPSGAEGEAKKKTGAGAPVPAPTPARTPEGPPPMPLPSVPAAGAPQPEKAPTPLEAEEKMYERFAAGTGAVRQAGVAKAEPPKPPQPATATVEGRTTEPPYVTARKIYDSDKSETMPISADSRRLRERLADYGKGRKFFGEGKEWEPLKKALVGKDTLVRSVWEGMKKGSGLRIFKDDQRKLEDAERDRRLVEKITSAALKNGRTPAQAAEIARIGLEKYQEKRKKEREALGGIMEKLEKTMEEVAGAAKAGKEAAVVQEAAAKEAAKAATHHVHETGAEEEEIN